MVIKIGNTVLFRELSEIFEQNAKFYRGFNKASTLEEKEKVVKEWQRRTDLLIEFRKVDLQDNSGIKIHNVAPTDMDGKMAQNMIQITMNEVTVKWDLDHNKEVSFL